MIAAAFLALLLQAAAPGAAPPSQTQTQMSTDAMQTLFLFYRLRYFHEAAALRRCDRAQPERTRALGERYDALHRRLAERLGTGAVDMPSTGRPEPGEDHDCRMGVTLFSYERALGQLERHLAEGAQ